MPPTELTDEHRMWARKALPEINEEIESGRMMIEAVARQIANAESRQRFRDLGGVRVLRVIEYIYPDIKTALTDQTHWAVPGTNFFGKVTVRSTVLPLEVLG